MAGGGVPCRSRSWRGPHRTGSPRRAHAGTASAFRCHCFHRSGPNPFRKESRASTRLSSFPRLFPRGVLLYGGSGSAGLRHRSRGGFVRNLPPVVEQSLSGWSPRTPNTEEKGKCRDKSDRVDRLHPSRHAPAQVGAASPARVAPSSPAQAVRARPAGQPTGPTPAIIASTFPG